MVALVDNLKAFNKYPWGEGGICYERTLFGLQRDLENRVSKYQNKKKTKDIYVCVCAEIMDRVCEIQTKLRVKFQSFKEKN